MISLQLSLIFLNLFTVLWIKIGIVEGIIGGRDAQLSQVKYQVSIRENYLHICNGVIISPQHVLTVAHCFINGKNEFIIATNKNIRYTVLAGVVNENDKTSTRVEKGVAKIYIPDGFALVDIDENAHTFKDDIAVLKVYSVLYEGENKGVAKLGLPVKLNPDVYKNSKLIVSSYGFIYPVKRSVPAINRYVNTCTHCEKLKLIEASVLPNKECSKINKRDIKSDMICAQVAQKSKLFHEATCEADDGAPLVLNGNLVIGVLSSRTLKCNEKDQAAVYTNVDSFNHFIVRAMRSNNMDGIRVQEIFIQKT